MVHTTPYEKVLTYHSGSGDSRDDEVMYQTETNSAPSTAIANADRPIQSERDIGAGPHSAYGITSSTATANTDRAIQSERDIGTGAQSNPGITSKLGYVELPQWPISSRAKLRPGIRVMCKASLRCKRPQTRS